MKSILMFEAVECEHLNFDKKLTQGNNQKVKENI